MALLLVCALVQTVSLHAETLTVTSLADSGEGTLRAAITAAADDDTIEIPLSGNLNLQSALLLSRPVTIHGPGSEKLKVRRGEGVTAKFSLFEIRDSGGVTISDLTITDGYASRGGGVFASTNGPIVLEDCLFIGNQDDGTGGGGGAIHLHGGTNTTVRRCVIRDNVSRAGSPYQGGGGICVAKASLLLENSSLIGNTSGLYGGGLQISAGTAEVRNCTFSGNTPGRAGGAIGIAPSARLVLLSSTVTANHGLIPGIHNVSGQATIGNSILAGNGLGAIDYSGGALVSLGYNLVGNAGYHFFFKGPGDVVGVTDPKLAPLGYYGGSTLIHPPTFDSVHVIDKGMSTLGGITLPTDQQGNTRPVRAHWQDPAPGGDFSDIGAMELGEMPQSGGIVVVNTTDDNDDGVPGKLHCSLREALNYLKGLETDQRIIRFHPRVFGPGKPSREILLGKVLPSFDDTAIQGPGAKFLTIRRAATTKFGIFMADGFGESSISGLTLAGGHSSNGGGIYTNRPLTLQNCHIRDCTAEGTGGGVHCKAGGLFMRGCTLSKNRAVGGGGAGLYTAGELSHVENSTFDDNRAAGGFGGNIRAQGDLTVTACTLTRGYAARAGGGIAATGTAENVVTLRNCIVSGNERADVCGTGNYAYAGFVSGGFNVIGTLFYNPAFTNGLNGDQVGVTDPKLGPLNYNGGPTPTAALLRGSPAIDQGFAFGLAADQRGLARTFDQPLIHAPQGGDETDVGAFEAQRLSLDDWCRQYFTDEQLASAIAQPEGDANTSGIPNSLKHLFGIDPLQPMDDADRAALPKLSNHESGGREYLAISYLRSGLYSGPDEVVEYSTDLVEWVPAPRFLTSVKPVAPDSFDERVEVWVDMTGRSKAYLRIAMPE